MINLPENASQFQAKWWPFMQIDRLTYGYSPGSAGSPTS